MTFTSVILILVINMLMAFLLLFVSVQINSNKIRNSVKIELNNLSAEIASDTYEAMRDANLTAYKSQLYSSYTYQNYLTSTFRSGLAEQLPTETDAYKISGGTLRFEKDGESRIRFTYTCRVQFYISMFGESYPTVTRDITVTGYHSTKF